ncbi:MAG: glycosyltransferase family 2 protein [Xenococcus sp. (in: cyanobacteria)]
MLLKQPLVSIIVNNYNYAQFLSEAIASACNQTYPQVEVIVVDDGSIDNSRDIISSWKDSIIPVYKENGGQASAFNAGFATSKGDIVLFLDADDYLFPEAVERIVSVWQTDTVKAHFMLKGIDAVGESLGYTYPARGEYLGRGNVIPKLLSKGVYGVAPTSANALSRDALSQIFPIEEEKYRISADGYLATAIAFSGKIVALEETLGAYRVHGNNNWGTSMSGKKFRSFIEHDLRKYDLLVEQATNFGYEIPGDLLLRTNTHLWARISSLRLDPQNHPIADDNVMKLIYHGIYATWYYNDLNWKKRFVLIAWFLTVGLIPISISQHAIGWLFAQESRPKSVKWILNRLRPLLNWA